MPAYACEWVEFILTGGIVLPVGGILSYWWNMLKSRWDSFSVGEYTSDWVEFFLTGGIYLKAGVGLPPMQISIHTNTFKLPPLQYRTHTDMVDLRIEQIPT